MSDRESLDNVNTRRQRDVENPSVTTRVTTAPLLLTGISSNHLTSIPELYHLTGIKNYGSWAFKIKNVLMKDGLFDYCTVAPNHIMNNVERKDREAALFAINSSVKGDVALKLLKSYSDPFDC